MVKGWQNKLFSASGKEVHLKAVVQAIPTYSMYLSRLSQGLVDELHRLSAQFWWGTDEEKKRIHLCKWSKLCHNKDVSGLTFCDLAGYVQRSHVI
ncbi:hypothetical protein Ddye_008533 [Dipteronia dyeriana]|uniref:Reverse transcriptase n=1 Tax=Dipteronia dyeriana TaxID=168575 RepID=A0AAE0CLG6_9ROSI|nr:hypothetical protein Ddye_008533 [Dipteronia dyeriana]